MRRLRLMADYECHPLWEAGDNVDPWTLGLPRGLADALSAWAADFDATLNEGDPPASGFADEGAAQGWLRQGDQLAERLRTAGFAVDRFHDGKSSHELVATG